MLLEQPSLIFTSRRRLTTAEVDRIRRLVPVVLGSQSTAILLVFVNLPTLTSFRLISELLAGNKIAGQFLLFLNMRFLFLFSEYSLIRKSGTGQ